MKLYLIPGMGVDCRLFNNLQMTGIDFTVIEWKQPIDGESLVDYAKRMAEEIKEDRFILGGVSFGGVVANEISKIKKPEQLILISTIKSSLELPPHLRILRSVPLHKSVPDFLYNKGSVVAKLIRPVFGMMDQGDRDLFNQMVEDVDPQYLKWAMNAIINWKSEHDPKNFIRIHGTHDAIFPVKFIKPPFVSVPGGSHFLICTRANEIEPVIRKALEEVRASV